MTAMPASMATPLILVIDDDDDIRELLQTLLEAAGYAVDTMQDGIDAVTLKKYYDVIVLDLKMPIFDGARLTDYWKLTDPAILRRVILLTGFSRLSSDQDFGTFASLAKPFHYREFIATVEACINESRVSPASSFATPDG